MTGKLLQSLLFVYLLTCCTICSTAQETPPFCEVEIEIHRKDSNSPVLNWVNLVNVDDSRQVVKGSLVSHEDTKDIYHFQNVPRECLWRINAISRKFSKNKAADRGNSKLLKFSSSRNSVMLDQTTEEQTELIILVPRTATDAEGADSSRTTFLDDPELASFLDDEGQQKGRTILRDMHEVNKYWLLKELPPEIASFSYDFAFENRRRHSYPSSEIPAAMEVAERRGVGIELILDYLIQHPDEILFRSIQETEDQIILGYAVPKPIRLTSLGGMEGDAKSFASQTIQTGVITLDKKLRPLEHRSLSEIERYFDYVELMPGKYAPLQITRPGTPFKMEFQIIEPALWIFKGGSLNLNQFVVENVEVVRRLKP